MPIEGSSPVVVRSGMVQFRITRVPSQIFPAARSRSYLRLVEHVPGTVDAESIDRELPANSIRGTRSLRVL